MRYRITRTYEFWNKKALWHPITGFKTSNVYPATRPEKQEKIIRPLE